MFYVVCPLSIYSIYIRLLYIVRSDENRIYQERQITLMRDHQEQHLDNQQTSSAIEPVSHQLHPFTAMLLFQFGLFLFLFVVIGMVKNWILLTMGTTLLIQMLLVLFLIALPLTLLGMGCHKGYHCYLSMKQAKIATLKVQEELEALRDERIRRRERHAMELYLLESRLPADQQGNRAAIYNRETESLLVPPSGNYAQPVPTHYAPTFEYTDTSTQVEEEGPHSLPPVQPFILPTFGQLLSSGEISPQMHEILMCFELLMDERTGQVTGFEPYRDRLENNSTMFLAGASKSGKTTIMAHIAAQQALLNAAFYVIDPHLSHPEKSLARKLAPLSHAFILPPAQSDAEIFTVLTHAKAEVEARVEGRETSLTGRPIVFLVDEVLAVLARAQRTQNKEVISFYRDFALFLRDLGTQYAKWHVSGILASQYVTKDAFSLPGGKIDFRDGCHNQIILRLPPNQAQALRL
jgi:hypothetical protein